MAAKSGGSPARVAVAIDFGTTFSGFAYARSSEPDDVFKIYEWPGASRASAKPYCKTLTALYYAPSSAPGAPFQLKDWGWSSLITAAEAARAFSSESVSGTSDALDYQIHSLLDFLSISSSRSVPLHDTNGRPDLFAFPAELAQKVGFFATKFKLYLAPGASAPELPGGLTVEQLVVDYLRCFSSFVMSELQVNYGKQFSMRDVQWCLTVPAIWDEKGKQVMRVCAEKAGMLQGASNPNSDSGSPFTLDIILEPEAASVYCQQKSRGLNLKRGDKLLVADVGGGTIDLVVHEKEDDGPKSLRVHEVVSSYGDLGGGTFVDANFFRHVCQKIHCFEEFSRRNKSEVHMLYQWWQGVKAGFDGESFCAEVTLSRKLGKAWENSEKKLLCNGRSEDYYDQLRMEGREMKAIFDPEVDKVISLVNRHLHGVRMLMVVGGFSASPYLREQIKSAFSGKVEDIIIPENPGSAICHGAVLLHFRSDSIQSRIAKRTYGLCHARAAEEFDPFDLLYVNDDGRWRCGNCIDIFVRTGQRVALDASVIRKYNPTRHRQTVLCFDLFSSSAKNPRYIREEGVEKEGTFSVDMSEGLDMDKERCVQVTMIFGASGIVVSAERTNFGQAGEERGLAVAFHAE